MNQVGGTNKIIYRPALTTNTFTPTTALPNGNYQAWVRPLAVMERRALERCLQLPHGLSCRSGDDCSGRHTHDVSANVQVERNRSVAKYDLWVTNLTSNVRQFFRTDVTVTGQKQLLPASVITTGRVITYEDLSLTLATANISTVPPTQASLLQTALRAKGGALANVTVTYLSSTQDYQVEFPTSTTSALKYVSGGVTCASTDCLLLHSTALPAGDYRWWVQAVSTKVPEPPGARQKTSRLRFRRSSLQRIHKYESATLHVECCSGFVKFDLWVNNLTTNTAQVLRVQDLTTKSYQAVLPLETERSERGSADSMLLETYRSGAHLLTLQSALVLGMLLLH